MIELFQSELESGRTIREVIRIRSLVQVAANLVSSDIPFTITGSAALMLHSVSGFRLPADLDVVFESETSMRAARDILYRRFGIQRTPQPIVLFSGEAVGIEMLLDIMNDSNQLQDRLPCQMLHSNSPLVESEKTGIDEWAVRIETLPSLVAGKLHALFKPRSGRLISSRCRDLFDFALLSELEKLPSEVDVAPLLRSLLDGLPEVAQFPEEWRPAWRELERGGFGSTSIDDAWRLAQKYVSSVWHHGEATL